MGSGARWGCQARRSCVVLALGSVVGDSESAGAVQPGAAGGADRGGAALVLVVGGGGAGPRGPAPRVVLGTAAGRLGCEGRGVADLVQVWPIGLDVAEQALDPGLIGRGAGPAEVLRDRAHDEELARGAGGHLRPVVADGEQHRPCGVIDGRVSQPALMLIDAVEQVLELERCVNASWTCRPVSSPDTISQIHLRVTRSMITVTYVLLQRANRVVS